MSQKKFRLLFRIGYINAVLYIIILSCALSANSQLSNIVEKGRGIIAPNEDTSGVGEINLRIDDNENETNDDEENDTNKFSWKTHQDDHSIYAHRSLMSTANIEKPNLESTEDEEQAEPAGLAKPGDPDDELAPLKTIDFAEKEWQLMFRSFDLMFDGVSSSLIQEIGQRTNLLKEVVSRLKPECRRDIDHIRRSVKQHKLWALKMVDSIGKIPSGITYGKFSSPGDYEECLSVRINEQVYTPHLAGSASSSAAAHMDKQESSHFSTEQHRFHGKYCLIDFRLPLPERPKAKLLSIHEPVIDLAKTEVGKQFPDLQNYSGYAAVFYEVGYMHAVCLPSTCDVLDLTRSLGKALEGLHIIVNNTVDCEERPDETPAWRTSQVIATALLVILFANATCATTMRYFSQNQKKGELKSSSSSARKTTKSSEKGASRQGWLVWAKNVSAKNRIYSECFSVQSNFERLSKPDPRGLTFVHYTRIVAMALTVITHTAGLGTLQAITKPADTSNSEQIFRDLIPQMLANAFTSIQIFFFMAGFMLVISTYPSINREKGHMSFLEYAIKRAIRLMPGLAATICINFLWPLLVDGPMLSYFVRIIVVPCETNWWRTMAFLSNFDHVEKMCLRHSYFSASDYQLHILAFPLLILLYKQPNLSLIIAGLLTCAGFVVQVIMILTKTVLPFMMVDYIDKQAFFNVVHYIHHPSWNHMSAFFYGFIIGYLVVKQIRINLSDTTIKRIWYTILPIGFASIFAPYFWNHYKRPIYRWQMVLYVLFDRFALLTACAWVSYATMVLGRKPASPNKQAASGDKPTTTTGKANNENNENKLGDAKGLTNLPSTVQALAGSAQFERTDNIADVSADRAASEQSQRPTPLDSSWSLMPPKTDRLNVSSLSLTNDTNALTRQRSSPNFQVFIQQQDNNQSAPATLRPAISSSNVHSEAAARDHAKQSLAAARPTAAAGTSPDIRGEQRPPRKPQAAVSNVNTLCLILSRLTFQLYLFNMVVLWIDVNHSKYYWFFSYYFIITKALAIYICSSLLALVFFVTLESPSLTLYIIWVKSRAQARAERGTQAANNKDGPAGDDNGAGAAKQQPSSGRTLQESPKFEAREAGGSKPQTDPFQLYGFAAGSPSSQRDHSNHQTDQFGGSSDCLSIKMGSPITIAVAEPTSFSYIDLSTQTQSTDKQDKKAAASSLGTFTGFSDALQTKM